MRGMPVAVLALILAACAATPSTTKTAPPPNPTLNASPPAASTVATQIGSLEPLAVVGAWVEARNRGDVEGAMRLVGSTAILFGVATQSEAGRVRFRSILEGQHEAAHRLEDEGCTADGPRVRCRYRQVDAFLAKCGLTMTGEHRYLVYDGKLALAERTHDPASEVAVYAALDAFRQWVAQARPDLEAVIWADSNSRFYTTLDGARAMLEVLDQYDC